MSVSSSLINRSGKRDSVTDRRPESLEQIWSIGFNGKLKDAVHVSPSGKYLYLPRGNSVVIYPLPLPEATPYSPPAPASSSDARPNASSLINNDRRPSSDSNKEASGRIRGGRTSAQAVIRAEGRNNGGSDSRQEIGAGAHREEQSQKKLYLKCHRHMVNAMAVSKSEQYLASGESHPGNGKAETVIWRLKLRSSPNQGEPEIIGQHNLHWSSVSALAFSPNDLYLASLGGPADGSLNIFDIRSRKPITGCKAVGHNTRNTGSATCVTFHPTKDNIMVVAGTNSFFCLWIMNPQNYRLTCKEIELGSLMRNISCVLPIPEVTCEATSIYAGTESGDVLKFRIYDKAKEEVKIKESGVVSCSRGSSSKKKPMKIAQIEDNIGDALFLGALAPRKGSKMQPTRNPFNQGIFSIHSMPSKTGFLVGCGDGTLALVEDRSSYEDEQNAEFRAMKARKSYTKLPQAPVKLEGLVMKVTNSVILRGSITGIALHCASSSTNKWTAIVTTSSQCLYRVDFDTFKEDLILSNHDGTINALAMPRHCSEANFFATAGGTDIRLWGFAASQPLKIFKPASVGTRVCLSMAFFPSIGTPKFIFSGWDDGAIRAWGLEQSPASGAEPAMECLDCHPAHSVPGLGIVCGGNFLLSGGSDGSVKLWEMYMTCGRRRLRMDKSSRHHKGPVHALVVEENRDLASWDLRFASASQDRTCIVWNLRDLRPLHVFKANCIFHDICFHPKEPELLTAGSDARIHLWDAFSGAHIRSLITPICETDVSSQDQIPGHQPWDGKPKIGLNGVDIETSSGDGDYFVTGGESRVIQVWDYVKGQRMQVSQELTSSVKHVKLHSCGNLLVAATEDGTIICYRLY